MARETFILQFDIKPEPNQNELCAIRLSGDAIRFKAIPTVTANDIFEVLTGIKIYDDNENKIKEETENEQND